MAVRSFLTRCLSAKSAIGTKRTWIGGQSRRRAADHHGKCPAVMMKAKESGSALQRLDARIKAMESKVEGLKALKPVTEGLYAVLSDEQKKKADQLLGGGCGMM